MPTNNPYFFPAADADEAAIKNTKATSIAFPIKLWFFIYAP
jgi:hypothetical protein